MKIQELLLYKIGGTVMSTLVINKILYAEISIIGIVFTAILLKKSIPKQGIKAASRQLKVFIAMLFSLIIIFVLDGITWYIDGMSFKGIKEIYSICLLFYFSINPMLGFLWNIYVNVKIHTNINRLKKYIKLYMVPFAVNAVLCVSSPFTGWIFKIDENGTYTRGVLYPVNVAVSFVYYILSVLTLINHMKKNERYRTNKEFVYLAFFPVAPLVGSVLQNLIYGISVVYICVLISFLIIFINVQNEQIYTDSGTGLRNKSFLSVFFNDRLMSLKRNNVIGVVLLDLDYFKTLNDTYGHTAGDEALKDVAHILNKVFDTNADCLCRFGGDEFVVLMVRSSEEDIKRDIERLKLEMRSFNERGERQYKLYFSVGYGMGRGDESIESITLDGLLKTADANMYADKKINHESGSCNI